LCFYSTWSTTSSISEQPVHRVCLLIRQLDNQFVSDQFNLSWDVR
jgi:hypothetical protein